jgi:hypothetical protein
VILSGRVVPLRVLCENLRAFACNSFFSRKGVKEKRKGRKTNNNLMGLYCQSLVETTIFAEITDKFNKKRLKHLCP